MTRVSLKEAYDNKDVVAQIYSIRDTANTANTTANTANTTANEAKTHVDTVAVDAERAVVTANKASNQAQTIALGFNTRLTDVETQTMTIRSNISRLDIETEDLYDKDAQSVKLAADHIQEITGGLDLRGTNRASDTTVGQLNNLIVNAKRLIEEVDAKLNAYAQMVRTTGNQDITGVKTFNTVTRIKNANDSRTVVPASQVQTQPFQVIGGDDQQIVFFQLLTNNDGSRVFVVNMYGTDGTRGRINLMNISGTGQVTFPWS